MANYTNQLTVLLNGRIQQISAADNLIIGGSFTASSFSGSGASLTSLDAGNLASGTVASGRISGSYTGITGVGTLTAGAIGTGFTAIDDSHLSTISTAGKVSNSATTATSANTVSAIVARDASGNFSAGTITADLSGNASTATTATYADYSSGTLTLNFTGGDVTGSIGIVDLDTSYSIDLTIAAGSVENAMLAGSIADSKLLTISTAGKVSNSATTATSANTASAIVARDASGNFTAGTISADLSGTATEAGAWSNSRTVTFSGGNVTGSFSIDGSSDVSGVSLSIAAGAVTNAMLAGSIADSKLSTITSAGKVADTALSANIPKLDAATNAFTGSMSITGSLNVTGPIVSGGEVNVIVHDAFLDLIAGNVGTTSKAGGFTFNIKKATGFTAEEATAFVAGVAPNVSAPTMAISGSALTAGDIVEVHSTTGGLNDGLYVVESVSASDVTIKGIGGSLPSANVPFVRNQFVASTGETATVIKVDLAVFAVSGGALTNGAGAISTGTFCYNYQAAATESSFAGSWTSISSVSTPTLQDVYGAGTAGIVLTNGRNFSIAKPTTGGETAAISLQANLGSKFEVVGAQLDLQTSGTAADVVLTASKSVVVASPLMLPTGDGSSVVSSGVGFLQLTASGVSEGSLLYIDSDGVAKKVACTTGRKVQCVALEATGGSQGTIRVASVFGSKVYVTITGTAPAFGDELFLSAVAGAASKTPPASGKIMTIGEVCGAAIGSHYPVIYNPQNVADI